MRVAGRDKGPPGCSVTHSARGCTHLSFGSIFYIICSIPALDPFQNEAIQIKIEKLNAEISAIRRPGRISTNRASRRSNHQTNILKIEPATYKYL